MPWQPPIPSGALWSKPVRDLNDAAALLAYLYDLVERDGTVTLSLQDAASTMEVPYPTIRRWWKAVREGPWFASVKDHGRKGYFITFKPGWLDWRILSTRPAAPSAPNDGLKEFSTPDEGSGMNLDNVQSVLKEFSTPDEGSGMIHGSTAYKVLHDDHIQTPSPSTKALPRSGRDLLLVMVEQGVTNTNRARLIAEANPELDAETLRVSFENLRRSGWAVPWILDRLDNIPPLPGEPYQPVAPDAEPGTSIKPTPRTTARPRFGSEQIRQQQQRRNGGKNG